jgi:uncharacterized membrane protein
VKGRTLWGGVLMGVGLGGFVDGIVFHQILQWHHMLSSTDRWPLTTQHGLKVNTLADGIFHAAMWVVVLAGVLLMRNRMPPRRELYGLLLAGWGAFNLVEGVVDHELLGIHHVRSGPHHRAYDWVFIAVSVVLVLAGARVARRNETAPSADCVS